MVIRQARLTHVVLYMKSNVIINSSPLLLALFLGVFLWNDHREAEITISQLHPQVQAAIRAYQTNQSQLKIGDLVEVSDLDNLESGRIFVVDRVERGQVYLSDYRSPKGEVMMLKAGSRAAVEMTGKHSFRFIRQNDLAWQPIANWYWIQ